MKSFYQNWKLDSDLPMIIFRGTDLTYYAHFHTEIEFIYVESGSILVGVNEEQRVLTEGDMVICSSNDIHYFDSRKHSSKVIVVIFKPEIISLSVSWPDEYSFATPFISADHPKFDHIHELLQSIIKEKDEVKPGHQLFIRAKLMELCGTLQRYLPTHNINRQTSSKLQSKRARMQQILSYIRDHYDEDLSVERLSRQFQMEPSYFCRTFKGAVGMNFKTYLNTIRVLTAERKLISTDESITDIAMSCGFNSIRTFNRVYKDIRGCVPSQSRNTSS